MHKQRDTNEPMTASYDDTFQALASLGRPMSLFDDELLTAWSAQLRWLGCNSSIAR